MSDPVESYTEPRDGAWAAICASPNNTRAPQKSEAAKLSNLVFLVCSGDIENAKQFPELLRIEYTDNSLRAVFPVKHMLGFSHDEQVAVLRSAKIISIVVTDGAETVTRQVWPNESHYDKEAKREGVLKLQSLRTIGVSDDSPMELRVHWEVHVRPPAIKGPMLGTTAGIEKEDGTKRPTHHKGTWG